ncbi:hypothetical protein KBX19_09765 [Corynebacterium sp. CCUG 71335]|uniref:hypothetical protein n=1 Tax=Corynebacterium sp. CCUG 71335 TaxID=2823892 RepID=UPI00210B16F6|nr:hypothetical protein [Corynebacterium sp. CCUG 71335]MCQ4621498.1 hypothetical protein [Corynebacterium sp. CCUG 71335]
MISAQQMRLKVDAAAKSIEHEIVACIRPDIAGHFSAQSDLASAVLANATEDERQQIVDKLLPRANGSAEDIRSDHHRRFLGKLGITDLDAGH